MLKFDDVDVITSIVSFEDLSELCIGSTLAFREKTFVLLFRLAGQRPDYFESASGLIPSLMEVSTSIEIWSEVIHIVSPDPDVFYCKFAPLLLILIWTGTMICFHIRIYGVPKSDLTQLIESMTKISIQLCIPWIPAILADSECVSILRICFPFLFYYPSLFPQMAKLPTAEVLPVDPVSRESCPELRDDIWIEKESIVKGLTAPPPPKPLPGLQFLLNLLSSMFVKLEFEIPLPPPKASWKSCIEIPIFDFLSQLMIGSPLLHSKIYFIRFLPSLGRN
jgi:hypothetical protein